MVTKLIRRIGEPTGNLVLIDLSWIVNQYHKSESDIITEIFGTVNQHFKLSEELHGELLGELFNNGDIPHHRQVIVNERVVIATKGVDIVVSPNECVENDYILKPNTKYIRVWFDFVSTPLTSNIKNKHCEIVPRFIETRLPNSNSPKTMLSFITFDILVFNSKDSITNYLKLMKYYAPIKRVFLSLGMSGRTDEEIHEELDKMKKYYLEINEELEYPFRIKFIHNADCKAPGEDDEDNISYGNLYYLGEAIKKLDYVDDLIVYLHQIGKPIVGVRLNV